MNSLRAARRMRRCVWTGSRTAGIACCCASGSRGLQTAGGMLEWVVNEVNTSFTDLVGRSAEACSMQHRFERPASIAEASRLLAAGGFAVLAGGTDLYPAHVGRPIATPLVDITGI